MKENLLKNKIVWGEHTEIASEIHMKEREGVLIMQLSLQLSRLDKMICYSTFCDDQFICLVCISIFVISEVFADSSLTGVGCFFTYVSLYLSQLFMQQRATFVVKKKFVPFDHLVVCCRIMLHVVVSCCIKFAIKNVCGTNIVR